MKTVVIDVKKWGRDEYFTPNGKCCAIGFAYKAFDPTVNVKTDVEDLVQLETKNPELNALVHQCDSKTGRTITKVNDSLYGKERRDILKKMFKNAGLRLIFKNLGV